MNVSPRKTASLTLALAFTFALALLAGCGESSSAMKGTASVYADSLHGNTTASGELYDKNGFTAAHRTLPFDTMVMVTRDNGRWVIVRVNDRGPYSRHIVDLSRAAGERLGMIDRNDHAGIAPVKLCVLPCLEALEGKGGPR